GAIPQPNPTQPASFALTPPLFPLFAPPALLELPDFNTFPLLTPFSLFRRFEKNKEKALEKSQIVARPFIQRKKSLPTRFDFLSPSPGARANKSPWFLLVFARALPGFVSPAVRNALRIGSPGYLISFELVLESSRGTCIVGATFLLNHGSLCL